jgi:hypothetical protein
MIASPKVPNMNLYPYHREICFEFDRKRYAGRKELRNPPSSSTRGSRRKNFWKDSHE